MPLQIFSPLWDELLAEGVVAITAAELAVRAGASSGSTYLAAHEAKRAGRLFSPTRGLYVLVPPEYRSWGVVPADWFIDDMMRYLDCPYYLGFLTAAAHHGASHQAAQVYQVVCSRKVHDRNLDGVRLRFYSTSELDTRPIQQITGPTGKLSVATPETCVLDMAEHPAAAGGIATVLEVAPELPVDPVRLQDAAAGRARSTVRRCGWLLSQAVPQLDLDSLRELAQPETGSPTPLVPSGPRRGRRDHSWGIIINTQVEEKL